ncbi:MAG TPA: cyclic nucleotide-binding domain-containing protein [Chloroflexota bacterium]|nr:cyclic nucleotide-binding domain-containing protein [Chloroflexota bacterium]HUM68994.1 cyclic nucleotide-binding domain-containing protein [Chloroflexota bacterium]
MSLSPETIVLLKKTPLFTSLSDERLQEIAATGQEVTFQPGDDLIRQDALTDYLYVLLDGRVAIEIENVSKIGERGARSILGELAMITQSPRNANCTAVTPVKAVQFKQKTFWPFVEQEPQLAIGLLTEVTYHLDETIDALNRMSKEVRELRAALDKLKK